MPSDFQKEIVQFRIKRNLEDSASVQVLRVLMLETVDEEESTSVITRVARYTTYVSLKDLPAQ